MKKILNTPLNIPDALCYPNCPRVLFTAFMRQLRDSTTNDPLNELRIKEFHAFCDEYFNKSIEPLLRDFTYDIDAWMNHLKTLNKQKEVLQYYNDYKQKKLSSIKLWNNNYTLFAKKEKQIVKDGKMPKCRAISACPPSVKWVGGAVCVALEQLFCNKLPGFKINDGNKCAKTWPEIEKMYEQRHRHGFETTIDIDGSAWDSTQKYHMKYLINKIYQYLVDNKKIYHVNPEIFIKTMTARYRNLTAKAFIDGKSFTIFSAIVDSTTFSGAPDTMLANTITNDVLCKFFMDVAGFNDTQFVNDCSGDDSHLATTHIFQNQIETIKTVWKDLGLIPKYIIVGDYSDITFCSTNVMPYYENGHIRMKIVRQLDRILPLGHWSETALHLSKGQLKTYYQQLAIGMNSWAHDMPFYSDYTKAYKTMESRIESDYEDMPVGKPKMHFETNIEYDVPSYTDDYKTSMRQSDHRPPDYVIYNFLLDKFHITKSEIDQVYTSITDTKYYMPI